MHAELQLDNQICFRLYTAARLVTQAYTPMLTELGITDMLMSIMPELKANYNFNIIPVLHRLKTHQYWQRWGAKEFYRDEDCVCYKLDI